MFTRQPDFIRKIAIMVGRVPLFKKLLRHVYSKYTDSLAEHRKELFRKNGLEILKAFDQCLTNNGFVYTLAFGSMLGAIREHGFIKHDLDLDVAMWIEDYSPKLQLSLKESGFILVHELLVESGSLGREETYQRDGVTIDIFYIYPAIDKYPYICDFLACDGSVSFADSMKKNGCIIARRLQLPWQKDIKRVPFETLNLPVCLNAEEILRFRYGDDYMTPNPEWQYTDDNIYTTVWENIKAIANVY